MHASASLALLAECMQVWRVLPGKQQLTALLLRRLKGLSPEDMLIYQQIAAAGNMGEGQATSALTHENMPDEGLGTNDQQQRLTMPEAALAI